MFSFFIIKKNPIINVVKNIKVFIVLSKAVKKFPKTDINAIIIDPNIIDI